VEDDARRVLIFNIKARLCLLEVQVATTVTMSNVCSGGGHLNLRLQDDTLGEVFVTLWKYVVFEPYDAEAEPFEGFERKVMAAVKDIRINEGHTTMADLSTALLNRDLGDLG
jgi:hypothetical protein